MGTQNNIKTMRDILQLAIVKFKFEKKSDALYRIAFGLSAGRNTLYLDVDSDKEIIDELERLLEQEGFGSLEMNSERLFVIPVVAFKLQAKVK